MDGGKKAVTYFLPAALIGEVDRRADRERRKKSAVIERAVREYLARRQKQERQRATA